MDGFRMLLDNDMNKIIDFVINNEFENGLDMYISKHLNINLLKNESTLRPLLFEGNLICYGKIYNEVITHLAIVAIPDCNLKSKVVNIYQLSKDNNFINAFIDFIKKFLIDSNYSKLRISIINDNSSDKFIETLKGMGFISEVELNGNLGNKLMLSMFINEVV